MVKPLKPCKITEEVKRRSLAYIMFLKMKSNGNIKARGCTNERPQHIYKSKEDTSLSTAAVESIFITSVMVAKEGRYVASVDIPGTFLQTEVSDDTMINLQEVIV